ncbi:MAG: 30S ribosomal protein S6 [Proteobacteria bacterium]|nr:30S ribosomal protein S6 [Pseudomonadota bacterium]
MPFYESVFIARQDISQTQVDGLVERYTGIISEGGGQIAANEYWGLRNLAFRIRKNRKGHYVMLNIEAPATAIAEMERNMRIDEDVMRYMTLKVEGFEEGPSAIMRGRDDRRGGGGRRDRPGDRDRPGGGRDRDRGDDRAPRQENTERAPRQETAKNGDSA